MARQASDYYEVFIRFTGPSGKTKVRIDASECISGSHSELKEIAMAKADPSGRRNIVECRVVR